MLIAKYLFEVVRSAHFLSKTAKPWISLAITFVKFAMRDTSQVKLEKVVCLVQNMLDSLKDGVLAVKRLSLETLAFQNAFHVKMVLS